jgi:putative ABC transport system substrate-binding protein
MELPNGTQTNTLWRRARHYPSTVGCECGEDTTGHPAALAAKAATSRVPIVALAVVDPGPSREPADVQRAEDVDPAFRATNGHIDGLVVFPEGLLWTHRSQIVDAARAARLPTIYGWRAAAEIGGLMSYGPDLVDLFRRGASYVDKIIRGRKPAELPIQQPTKFELVVNLGTAQALGLTIPPGLLARADQTIE